MNKWLLIWMLATINQSCLAGTVVVAPTPSGPVGNPFDTTTPFPFLIKQFASLSSMRYQQVYNASLFMNVDPSCVYISVLGFRLDPSGNGGFPWTVTNMQINLSTTQRAADSLSTNFAENTGPDDTIAFGPHRHDFPLNPPGGGFQIPLDSPFRYDPGLGNLLLDVRIFNGRGPFDMNNPTLDAQSSPTDETSRVWATNVAAGVATSVDTTGLAGGIQFSAVPSLLIYTSTFGTPTNYFAIEWPSQPSVFQLQRSTVLEGVPNWQVVPNAVAPRYFFPVESGGSVGFYRLVWPSGQPVQPVTVPAMPTQPQETLQPK